MFTKNRNIRTKRKADGNINLHFAVLTVVLKNLKVFMKKN